MNTHDKLRECEERLARMRRAVTAELRKKIVAKSKGYACIVPNTVLFKDKRPRKIYKTLLVAQVVGFYRDGVVYDLLGADDGEWPRVHSFRILPIEDLIVLTRYFDRYHTKMEAQGETHV